MRHRTETAFSPAQMQKVLPNLPAGTILVGGQALIFWMSYYDLPKQDGPAVSKDLDILGERNDVALIASAVGGIAEYPPQRTMTIIAGQIFIRVESDHFMNIDVIHKLGNMDKTSVIKNAVSMMIADKQILVMHPLDVLESRVKNYYSIKEKQNEFGLRQVLFAIDVAMAYLAGVAMKDEAIALQAIERIFSIAKSPAGNFARKHNAEVLTAIRPSFLRAHIANENFLENRLPRLKDSIRSLAGDEFLSEYITPKP